MGRRTRAHGPPGGRGGRLLPRSGVRSGGRTYNAAPRAALLLARCGVYTGLRPWTQGRLWDVASVHQRPGPPSGREDRALQRKAGHDPAGVTLPHGVGAARARTIGAMGCGRRRKPGPPQSQGGPGRVRDAGCGRGRFNEEADPVSGTEPACTTTLTGRAAVCNSTRPTRGVQRSQASSGESRAEPYRGPSVAVNQRGGRPVLEHGRDLPTAARSPACIGRLIRVMRFA
jgi:hypothetical protein